MTSENSPLSLLDSSKLSVSNSARSFNSNIANSHAIEELRRKLRGVESENLVLKRALPHFEDARGVDCTEWAIKIANELEEQKNRYAESQEKLATQVQLFREYREQAEENRREWQKTVSDLKQRAERVEQENKRLREKLSDDESMLFRLQHGAWNINENELSSSCLSDAENFQQCLRHIELQSDPTTSAESTARTGRTVSDLQLRDHTLSLLDKLHSTAEFFLQLINNYQEHGNLSSANQELQRKIAELRYDLEKCIQRHTKQSRNIVANSSCGVICTQCEQFKDEQNALQSQLNRELMFKRELLANNEKIEGKLRVTRQRMEELKNELEQSRAKVEEIEQKLQSTKEYYKSKYGHNLMESSEEYSMENEDNGTTTEEHIRILQQHNRELNAKNDEILRAVGRLKVLNQEELNNKDIELQSFLAKLEKCEQKSKQLEQRLQAEKDAHLAKIELVSRYDAKLRNLRHILVMYGHYFDDKDHSNTNCYGEVGAENSTAENGKTHISDHQNHYTTNNGTH